MSILKRILAPLCVAALAGLLPGNGAFAAASGYTVDDDLIVLDGGGRLAVGMPASSTASASITTPGPTGPSLPLLAAPVPAAPAPAPVPMTTAPRVIGTPARPVRSGYDQLPRRLADMQQYERIAMQPYPDYDSLPLAERARLYSQQFALLHDREPVFSPGIIAEIEASLSTVRSREDLYKPPGNNRSRVNLDGISGPWSGGLAGGSSGTVRNDGSANAEGRATLGREPKMETLRGGWSLRGAIGGGK